MLPLFAANDRTNEHLNKELFRMMKSLSVPTLLLTLFLTGSVQAEDGWVSLFDGKTLNGWTRAARGVAEYEVKDGTIHGVTVVGSENTFLASDKEYGDFELEFEVKVHDKLNSGCQIRSREKTATDSDKEKDLGRFFGPQVEIEASPGQAGYVYGEAYGGGWRSSAPRDAAHSHTHVKNGEWNTFRIIAHGPRIETFINGTMVEDLTDEEIFKTHPKGKIGLQVHGIGKQDGPFDVAWKNIRIKEL
jgi:hypothetical protein